MVEEAKKALEKIIQKTSDNWTAFIDDTPIKGELVLTDKRIILTDNNDEILLSEINKIDFITLYTNPPQIEISTTQGVHRLSFERKTLEAAIKILIGDVGWNISDVSSYTAYWASLLTMAVFHHGNPTTFKLKELVQPAASIIPDSVRSIPTDYKITKPNKTLETTSRPLNKLRWITIGFIGAILTGCIAYMTLEYLMTL